MMYFSRRGREHGRLSDYVVFDDVVRRQVGGSQSMWLAGCSGERVRHLLLVVVITFDVVPSAQQCLPMWPCLQVVLADPGDAVILDGELVVWHTCTTILPCGPTPLQVTTGCLQVVLANPRAAVILDGMLVICTLQMLQRQA